MIWFGSWCRAASMYPEARSVGRWLRHGWHVAIAYVIGFCDAAIIGFNPGSTPRGSLPVSSNRSEIVHKLQARRCRAPHLSGARR